MTKKKERPDNVVYDEEEKKYNASVMQYATNIGAPAIATNDTIAWKTASIYKVNKQMEARYAELKKEYETLMEQYDYNNMIYNAKFNFEPVVGEIYHLYLDKKNEVFLSIINPDECSFNHQGSYRLNAEKMWERLDT